MLDPFTTHVYNMMYTIHCGLAIKPFNQPETTTITEKWVAEDGRAIIMQRVFE